MTPKQRVITAMRNGTPDCVPVMPQICLPHAIKALGMDYVSTCLEVIRKPEMLNRLVFECAKMYGVDGLRAWIPAVPADTRKIDGRWYGIDPDTGRVLGLVDFDGGGGIVPSEEPALQTEDDIDRIPVPSPEEILRSGKLDEIKAIVNEAGDDFFVASYAGNFTVEYLTFNRGKVQAMMDLLDAPDFCHKAQEKALQAAIHHGLALAEIGVDAIMVADTFGGIISPSQFREFCLPYFKRFVQAIKEHGPLIYMHICGDSSRILEMIADTGVDCVEPLDPLGGVSVRDAKERVGSRVALMGGVHTVTLAHGTQQEVIDDCRRCLDEGAVGGGYILAAGDMLPTETSREKVETMIEAAHNYKY